MVIMINLKEIYELAYDLWQDVLDERFYYVAIWVTLYQHLPMNHCLERIDKGVDMNRREVSICLRSPEIDCLFSSLFRLTSKASHDFVISFSKGQ